MSYITTPWGDVWIGPGPKPVEAPVAPTPSKPVPFIPAFETHVVQNELTGVEYPLNPDYFATPETADFLMKKFFAHFVSLRPSGANGGPFKVDGMERWLEFGTFSVNAGIIASYYARNPEDQFPGVADSLVKSIFKSLKEGK